MIKPRPLVLGNPSTPIVIVLPEKPHPTPLEALQYEITALRVDDAALVGSKVVARHSDRHSDRHYDQNDSTYDQNDSTRDYLLLEGGRWCSPHDPPTAVWDLIQFAERLQDAGAKFVFDREEVRRAYDAADKMPWHDRYDWKRHCAAIRRSAEDARSLGLNVRVLTYEEAILQPQQALLRSRAEADAVAEANRLAGSLK